MSLSFLDLVLDAQRIVFQNLAGIDLLLLSLTCQSLRNELKSRLFDEEGIKILLDDQLISRCCNECHLSLLRYLFEVDPTGPVRPLFEKRPRTNQIFFDDI